MNSEVDFRCKNGSIILKYHTYPWSGKRENTMVLIATLRERDGMSRNAASSLIDRYCGDDPATNLWTFERGARGAHQYRLLQNVEPISSEGDVK